MPGAPEVKYERELRLAVVMYGGVSLAVYMNGATQELLNLVRATARDPAREGHALYTDDELKNTSASVYRQLARVDDAAGARAQGACDPLQPIRRRFVVDILSGTSAGGINAVYLAKALANGQSLQALAGLWESEGDIGKLINDEESRSDCEELPPKAPPKSLLNGQRMYLKLLDAFEGMDRGPTRGRLVNELDLYVTATDLEGLPLRLRLGGGEVAEERRYRKSFHLYLDGSGSNDFERQDNPFLAFISRCTSSFPVAFEPTQFKETMLLSGTEQTACDEGSTGKCRGIPKRWARHFDEYDPSSGGLQNPQARPFADGGYLDNKPFSYAIEAISSRHVGDSGQVERKLIYIEPDPERLSARGRAAKPAQPPNVLENSLAVIQLRGYETIREELLRLRDRNRLVDKTRAVVAGVDADFEALGERARARLADVISRRDEFKERALDQVVAIFGAAYGGYHRLKTAQVTDELAEVIAQNTGIGISSDEFLAIRLLVRAWRNVKYSPNPQPAETGATVSAGGATAVGATNPGVGTESEFNFLTTFDLTYRIRRVSFVIEQIASYRTLEPKVLAETLGRYPSICGGPAAKAIAEERAGELGDAFDALRQELAAVAQGLRAARKSLLSPEPGMRIPEISSREPLIRGAVERIWPSLLTTSAMKP